MVKIDIIKHFFSTVSNVGTAEITDERLKRKVIISNRLAFTVGVLPIFTSIYLLVFLGSPMFFAPFLVGMFYFGTIILNKLNHNTISRIYITILPTINLMVVSGFLGDKYSIGIKFSYLSIIVAPIVLFDLNEKVKLTFGILWVIFMYYFTDYVNQFIPPFTVVDIRLLNDLRAINFSSLLSFIIFISGYLYLQQLNYNAEKQINNLLEETKQQKAELEQKNTTITDSINYAKTIQTAVLSNTHILDTECRDYFVLYKPKDIVSGDFYLFNKIEDYLILVVADCTGHGVSGALMSMLGISYLNEIIKKSEIKSTDHVLSEMRKQIKTVLNQNDFSAISKDGIDIVLVVVNTKTMEAQFSGANRPLVVIPADEKSEMIEYKPNKMPVGVHNKEEDFTAIDFKIAKGDTLYLFTDGYEDQFGGTESKKMKAKVFRDELLAIYKSPMQEQKQYLEQFYQQWKGNEPQTDDILLVGIRF